MVFFFTRGVQFFFKKMNIGDNVKTGITAVAAPKLPDISSAPHSALKIALQAMQDRCIKLQTRISRLEEENLHLRIGKNKCTPSIKPDSIESMSENKIEDLLGNKEFWESLSKLSSENAQALLCIKCLSQSSKSSDSNDTLNSKDVELSTLRNISNNDSMEDISLQDINLKNTIKSSTEYLPGKNRIGVFKVDGVNNEEDDASYESLEASLKEILINIKRDKDQIKKQQEGLKSALQIFKEIIKDKGPCKDCLAKVEDTNNKVFENKIVGTEDSLARGIRYTEAEMLGRVREGRDLGRPGDLKDRICPLCEEFFDCSTPFDVFNEHVLSHFVEEEDDSITDSFQLIA